MRLRGAPQPRVPHSEPDGYFEINIPNRVVNMGLNHSAIFDTIQKLAASDSSVSARMREVISACERDIPHHDWSLLSSLDYDKDVLSLTAWIPSVFKKQPAPFQIKGLWILLCNPCTSKDNVWADMYVGSMSQYASDAEELYWFQDSECHYPENAYAKSSSLRSIYKIGYADRSGLGNDAEWPLCLAFGVFAVHSLLRCQSPSLVGSTASRIGVVVGFDSGDMLRIGELTESGLVAVA
jgi:hypothetical protein